MDRTMTKNEEFLGDLTLRYEEWLEEAEIRKEGGSKDVLIGILTSLLLKERKERQQDKAICRCGGR